MDRETIEMNSFATDHAEQTRIADALFNPESVALVGASDDPRKATSRPLRFLRSGGFRGDIYPVSESGTVISGQPAFRSLHDLPKIPDHAYLMMGAGSVLKAVRDCAELGVPVATILSGGFAEAGPDGLRRQRRLNEAAQEGGVRLLGPNSVGIVNLRANLRLTCNGVFAEAEFPAGGTFVASQSGSMIGALASRGKRMGVGFSALVSVGGEADLDLGEICSLALHDPDITGYLLFLESIRHAESLAEFARAAAGLNKPVVAYKVGRSRLAAQLAVSHTGALVSEDDCAAQFLAECGIARVHTLEGLLDAQPLLIRSVVRDDRAEVAVITTTGGGAAIVVDQLALAGIHVRQPSDDTFGRLAQAGVNVERGTIVDMTMAGARPDTMRAALDILLSAPELDALIAVVGSSARLQPELSVGPIAETAVSGKVLAAVLIPDAPAARELLRGADVPVFDSPDACADVVRAAFSRRPPRERPIVVPHGADSAITLDEASAYATLRKVGIVAARHVARDIGQLDASSPDAIALPFEYPVVVKVLHPGIAHKSDVGGVVLQIRDSTSLMDAVRQVRGNASERLDGITLRRVLIQEMVVGVGELLIGYQLDPSVGPIVVVAAGGTMAELFQDRAVRLAPITLRDAREMLTEINVARGMRGYRHRAAGDLEAAAAALVALSQLVQNPEVVEAEINPLIVRIAGEGVLAVDALVRLRTAPAADGSRS